MQFNWYKLDRKILISNIFLDSLQLEASAKMNKNKQNSQQKSSQRNNIVMKGVLDLFMPTMNDDNFLQNFTNFFDNDAFFDESKSPAKQLHCKKHQSKKSRKNNTYQKVYQSQNNVTTTKYGIDGTVYKENYCERKKGYENNDKNIYEKQKAYQNNQGVGQVSKQRMINDQGRKVTLKKVGRQIQQNKEYFNTQEDHQHQFDQKWQQQIAKVKLIAKNNNESTIKSDSENEENCSKIMSPKQQKIEGKRPEYVRSTRHRCVDSSSSESSQSSKDSESSSD